MEAHLRYYTNDFWKMTYNNSSASRVTMRVTPQGGSAFNVISMEPHEAGPFLIVWDGRDPMGNIVESTSNIYFPAPTTLRPNYILVKGNIPKISGQAPYVWTGH